MIKKYLEIAKKLKPVLKKETINLSVNQELSNGQFVDLDFKNHYVGKISFKFKSVGRHADAPALIRFVFAEKKWELAADNTNYQGWIAKSWIQEELVHLDSFPINLTLSRRYAFRYVRVEVISISNLYHVVVDSAKVVATTSAVNKVDLVGKSTLEKDIDRVGLRTMHECMQDVFEDGPKRDRRLWLGDLRLQALVNYETYKNNALVKRCLYLFLSTQKETGEIPQSIFVNPKIYPDEGVLLDYSLLFIPTVIDYYKETKDHELLNDAFPLMEKQIKLFHSKQVNHLVRDPNVLGWCFIDWSLELKKECACNGVYLYVLKEFIAFKKSLNLDTSELEKEYIIVKEACLKEYYDEKKNLFIEKGQISIQNATWMVLGEVIEEETAYQCLINTLNNKEAIKIVTPYMYHHFLMALIKINRVKEANEYMNDYWGAMVKDGADTFYELFDKDNPSLSPYGSPSVNSYCHAWSCTPSYLLRKYFKK